MKATLYKLKEGYVLCSNEGQKEGDYIIHKTLLDKITRCPDKYGSTQEHWYKVLTQSPDFSELKEEDAKRIGWFDVEKLALKPFSKNEKTSWGKSYSYDNEKRREGFVIGFQKHAELTADRRFTEEDMREAFKAGHCYGETQTLFHNTDSVSRAEYERVTDEERFVKELSQPKSWEVECLEENGNFKIISIIQ